METWQVALVVGIVFVLPQAIGLIAARVGRLRSAATWPLAAVGVIGLFWVFATIAEHGSCVPTWLYAIPLMVLHFVVGSIFGVLDQRAQARTRAGR